MTRSHRRVHLVTWIILTPIILGVLLAGIAASARGRMRLQEPAASSRSESP